MDKHIVFVAHRETRTEGDETRYVPQFGGSNYDSLVTELDLVGYMEANGKERTITFDPTSRNDGKNTCNLPSIMKIPSILDSEGNPTANNTFFTDHIVKSYEKRLEARASNGQKYNELIQDLETKILQITDDASANDFVARIDKFEHIGNSKALAGKKLADKAKELGLSFNKTSKKYEKIVQPQNSLI